MEPYSTLPSIKQCQDFLEAINQERSKGNLPPLEYIDFDGADPGVPENCLSARNCYIHLNRTVGTYSTVNKRDKTLWTIPRSILNVTDAFDSVTPGLRERLVEAGVVKDD